MNIDILGCSGGIGRGLKTTTMLIDNDLLLDAGTGVELLTMEKMLQIRHILITHAHLDHVAGLPLMLATIFDRHQHPVSVYALPEVIAALRNHVFNWTMWPDYTQLPEQQPIVNFTELRTGDHIHIGGRRITALPANHPSPTIGYLIQDNNGSFAFSGDSGENPDIWPILNKEQPDLLIIDVSFTDEVGELAKLSGHLTPSQLAGQLQQLEYKPRIEITHLKPGFEDTIMRQCRKLLPDWEIDRLHHDDRIQPEA